MRSKVRSKRLDQRFNTSLDPNNLDRLDFLAKSLKTTRSGVIKLLLETANLEAIIKENEKYKKKSTSHNVHCDNIEHDIKLLLKNYFILENLTDYNYSYIQEEILITISNIWFNYQKLGKTYILNENVPDSYLI